MSAQTAHNLVLLAGHLPIRNFVRLIRTHAVDGPLPDEDRLSADWRDANSYLRQLESQEVAFADVPQLTSLPQQATDLAEAELQHPSLQRALSLLPSTWALVELDRVVTLQGYVDATFANTLRSSLPPHPTVEQLIHFAVGRSHSPPPMRVTQRGGNKFVVTSHSSDLRIIETKWMDPVLFPRT